MRRWKGRINDKLQNHESKKKQKLNFIKSQKFLSNLLSSLDSEEKKREFLKNYTYNQKRVFGDILVDPSKSLNGFIPLFQSFLKLCFELPNSFSDLCKTAKSYHGKNQEIINRIGKLGETLERQSKLKPQKREVLKLLDKCADSALQITKILNGLSFGNTQTNKSKMNQYFRYADHNRLNHQKKLFKELEHSDIEIDPVCNTSEPSHDGMDFFCAICGNPIVQGKDIFCISKNVVSCFKGIQVHENKEKLDQPGITKTLNYILSKKFKKNIYKKFENQQEKDHNDKSVTCYNVSCSKCDSGIGYIVSSYKPKENQGEMQKSCCRLTYIHPTTGMNYMYFKRTINKKHNSSVHNSKKSIQNKPYPRYGGRLEDNKKKEILEFMKTSFSDAFEHLFADLAEEEIFRKIEVWEKNGMFGKALKIFGKKGKKMKKNEKKANVENKKRNNSSHKMKQKKNVNETPTIKVTEKQNEESNQLLQKKNNDLKKELERRNKQILEMENKLKNQAVHISELERKLESIVGIATLSKNKAI